MALQTVAKIKFNPLGSNNKSRAAVIRSPVTPLADILQLIFNFLSTQPIRLAQIPFEKYL